MLVDRISSVFARLPDIDSDTFILWEPCSKSHREILPGYASYLVELGYKVLVLFSPAPNDEGLFERLKHPDITVLRLPRYRIYRLLRSVRVAAAAGVVISTAGKLRKRNDGFYDLARVFPGPKPKRLLLVEHNVRELVAAGRWDPSIITLRKITDDRADSVMVNPHDFGNVVVTEKNQKTVFLMVGAARAKRRNQDMVYEAANQLLSEGRTSFEIRLVGKKGEQGIPEPLSRHVVELGRLSFRDLYREVEDCDFILTAFQRDNPEHEFYRTTGTSGAFQLAYGFSKPCLVQQGFVGGTALTSGNSIFYDSDATMYDAMVRAIEMNSAGYNRMTQDMGAAAATLRQESLENLEAIIGENSNSFLL